MKRRICAVFFALTAAVYVFSYAVNADTGPKDSIRIAFTNMGTEACYCTLLSEGESTGPYSAGDRHTGDEIDAAFSDYKDTDGFYYLHYYSRAEVSKGFDWGYCPPSRFKILLYYPGTNTFAVSGIYEQYAFYSFFTVDMKDVQTGADNRVLTVKRTYSSLFVVFAFIMRVIITLAAEIAIALLFGFRQKKQIAVIIIINVITQLLLNLILYKVMVDMGAWFIFLYIPLELLIIFIEAVTYIIALRNPNNPRANVADCVLYAFLGNFASFIAGALISIIFPWVAM